MSWALYGSVLTLIGMVLLIAAGILHRVGWSPFLYGPVILAGASLTLIALPQRRQ